ncbi:UNVERIFIED_CONTAM: GtrA-like protein [Acetivibrio alkalicellulosi]
MFIQCAISKLKQHKFFSDLLKPEVFSQLKRYLITGFSSFSLEYILFRVFNEIIFEKIVPFGFSLVSSVSKNSFNADLDIFTYNYLLSNTIVYVFIFWFNFLANRIWSFKSKINFSKQLKQYLILFAFNLFAVNTLLYLFSEKIGIIPHISKILVMGSVVCWNFIIYKKVIYK